MNDSNRVSLLIRVAAVSLALAAISGRDTSAKVLFQAPPVPTVPGLMGYWKVDSDTGTVATDSAGTNTGTYSPMANPATASTTVLPPVPAGNTKSFNFVGSSNQFIEVPDSTSLSVTGSFTLAAWVRRSATNPAVQKGIIEKFDTGNGYSLRLGFNEHFNFSVYSGTTQKDIITTGNAVPFRGADLNTWNHVAGVYNQTGAPQMLIYKNGNRDATTSANAGQEPVAPPTDGTAALQIGKDYSSSNAFTGNIDEVRVYGRALNDAEVGILNTMVQPPATGLVATGGNSQNLLSWTAASNAGAVSVVYTVLRGTSTGVYTTAFNNISGTTFTDTTPTPGTQYFYVVVAVSVIPSANSNEQTATASNTPPPPPPPPRTSQVGGEDNPCGCGSASTASGWVGLLGGVLMLAAMAPALRKRRT